MMTRDEGRDILARYDAGRLAHSDRTKLVEEIAIAILRASVSSPSGSVTVQIVDAGPPPPVLRLGQG